MLNLNTETRIGDIASADYRTVSVFRQYHIDFCCNGMRTIGEICTAKGMAPGELIEKLQNTMSDHAETPADYQSLTLTQLTEEIVTKHHAYVQSAGNDILPLLHKLVHVHGSNHPELIEVEGLFRESLNELAVHMKKEELVLFPAIRKIEKLKNENQPLADWPFVSISYPIAMMNMEHNTEGRRFERIAELTNGYTPPADGCNTYRATLGLLKDFEEDLHLHIHLENNILFPTAIKEEHKLKEAVNTRA